MFPYCCLLIICIMLIFHVQFSRYIWAICCSMKTSDTSKNFIQQPIDNWQLTVDNEGVASRLFQSVGFADSSTIHYSLFTFHYWKWWAKVDSNHRPHDYQSCALASWAIGPSAWLLRVFKWWRLAGSNRWPPACKAGALPAELNPHIVVPSSASFASVWKPKAQSLRCSSSPP